MKLLGYNSQMETTIDSLRSTAFLFVGFFARARASVLAIVVASATAVGLAACGGGGGASSSTAYFHGAERVAGLQYRYESGSSGETDARGGFQFEQGKTVVFSVGEATPLGTVVVSSDAERDFVTPLRFVGNSEDQAVRVERLLIALDTDDSDSVINIPAAALTSATNLLTIEQLQVGNGNDGEAMGITVGGLILNIPTTERAKQELTDTNNCAYSGTFAGNLSDNSTVAFVLMPNLTVDLIVDLTAETLTLTTASPAISFIRDESGVEVAEALLTIDLKTLPLVATLELEGGTGMMTLVSYDRVEFGGNMVFGTVRRVAGDPNADYRLVGVYDGGSEGDGAFVADIYRGGNVQISDIRSPDFQDVSPGTHSGIEPGTTDLTLQVGVNSVTLTLSASSNIFLGAGGDIGGTWCEL